jgi:hypothetical protein
MTPLCRTRAPIGLFVEPVLSEAEGPQAIR